MNPVSALEYPLVLLRLLRPRQWTKNLVIFAPALFAKRLFEAEGARLATMAVASFCLLAGAVYVMNDWLDREKDRLHPEKSKRPLAAGLVSGPVALGVAALCAIGGALLALAVGPGFAGYAGAYVGLQIVYSTFLKHEVIVDVITIAAGFVLRVMSGAAAVDVPVSNWLYLCTLLLAIFLGFAKRRHELSSLQKDASGHRANLSEYSMPMLDQMLAVVAASCIVGYSLYTVSPDTIQHVGSDWLKLTVPCVIYGLLRYIYLIHHRNAGGSPERVLLSDRPMIINLVIYVAIAVWVLYRGH